MAYTPKNINVYQAALAGALAGMGVNASQGAASVTEAEFTASVTPVAGAFAEAFDLAWFATSRTPNQYDVESISEACNDAWIGRQPANNPTTLLAITWMVEAVTLVNLVISGDDYMTGQGITPTPIPGGSGGGSAGYVIFRPGVASTGSAVATWAEVQEALYNPATGTGARVIYVDSSHAAAQVPAGSTTNLQGFIELRAFGQGYAFEQLTIEDTALIQNPCRFGTGLFVTVECLTSPAFAFTIADEDPVLIVEVAAILENVAGSTVEAYKVPNGDSLDVFVFGGVIDGESATAGVFGAADGGGLFVAAFDGAAFTDTSFDSAAGGEFILEYDASVTPPAFSLLEGTSNIEAIDLYTNLNGGAYVIYRPGGIASGNVATTFAQLQAAVNAGAATIYVDSSLDAATIPAGEILTPTTGGTISLFAWNGQYSQNTPTSDVLTIEDTGQIQDLAFVGIGLTIECTCTTTPAFTFVGGGNGPQLTVDNATIQLKAGAGVPAYTVPNGTTFIMFGIFGAELESLQAGVALFSVGNGGTAEAFFGFEGNSINATTWSVANGGVLIYRGDASIAMPAFTVAVGGTLLNLRVDSSLNLAYSVTTTAARPTTNLVAGLPSFDSTLGIPIWRNATNTGWVNSAGGSV
jgi:hypothetical protein